MNYFGHDLPDVAKAGEGRGTRPSSMAVARDHTKGVALTTRGSIQVLKEGVAARVEGPADLAVDGLLRG